MKKIFFTFGAIILFAGSINAQCLTVDTCWAKLYNGSGNGADHLYDIKVSQYSGNIYVTGESLGADGNNNDYITIKYNPSGDTLWTRRYDGPLHGTDIAYAIAIDDSENVYVTGESRQTTGNGYDYLTIKYKANGDVSWVRTYDGTALNNDNAYSIFVDASHNVYVTGSGSETGGGSDIVTIKYNSNGDIVAPWPKKYSGSGSASSGTKVVVDISGNVWVTGYVTGSGGSGHNITTLKYLSDGSLAASPVFNGGGNNNDEPLALTIDNSGNAYMTGRTLPLTGLTDFVTIKYNNLGVPLWTKTYDGGDNNKDEANAIFVDSAGNVYVTGESRNSNNGADYLTIKYNSAGDSLWNARFDGTAHSTDIARAVIQGKNGLIFVGGGSNTTNSVDDFVIIEYDPLNGSECNVSRKISVGNDNIYGMGMDYNRNLLYACGETSAGGGSYDCMTARYCILGLTLTFNTDSNAIEGLYDTLLNRLNIKDTIRIYIRKATSPFQILDSAKGVIDSITLKESFVFSYIPSGIYYIVAKHRNSIETWSKTGGESLICGDSLNYDFTNAQSKAYGNNLTKKGTKYCFYSGDVNQNGFIDLTDILLIYNDGNIFLSGYVSTDLNGDYIADLSDMLIAYNNSVNFVSLKRP